MASLLSSAVKDNGYDGITIKEALTEFERQDIFRFRYRVLVKELGRKIPGVDHRRKRIVDEFDDWSYLAYAEAGKKIIGVVRLNFGYLDEFPQELIKIFKLATFKDFDGGANKICLGTKLMVAPEYRSTPALFQLVAKCYEKAREENVQFSFGGCNPYLIPMYEQIGYRQFTSGFQDTGYGFVVPTIILLEDYDHLKAVRSPLAKIACGMKNSGASHEWFNGRFAGASYQVGTFTSEDDRWEYLSQKCGDILSAFSLLKNLDKFEAAKLLHSATIFNCEAGQQFIRCGDLCNELYILICGEMSIRHKSGSAFKANPGDIIGSIGLFEQKYHEFDTFALKDCELLAISRPKFEKLRRSMPELAGKLNLEQPYKEEVKGNENQYRTAIG